MPEEGVETIVAALRRVAARDRRRAAVVSPGGRLNYGDLDDLSDAAAKGLLAVGLRPGDRVVFLVPPSAAMMVAAFAVAKAGLVPVLVDPGMGLPQVRRCLAEAEPVALLGVPRAVWAGYFLGWGGRGLRWRIAVGGWAPPGALRWRKVLAAGRSAARELPEISPEDQAAIAFTSGSTGPPKGVIYTHGMFVSQAELLRQAFDLQPGEVDLATFPLFALFDPYWEMTAVFPRMDFTRPGRADPREIARAMVENRVTHMFASPALLDRFGAWAAARGLSFPAVRRILSAGAPVGARILRTTLRLLQGEAEVYTPYGATEALPLSSIGARERLALGDRPGFGICVGYPLTGVEAEIIRITDEPVEEWDPGWRVETEEVGELVVWGGNVSPGYFRRPDADRAGKVRRNGRIGHRMGDLVRRDGAGRWWFCGRKSHRVLTPQGPIFPVTLECIFNAHPGVRRCAVVGLGDGPVREPVLCVEGVPRSRQEGLGRELLQLAAAHPLAAQIRRVFFFGRFPVDARHNAKIRREVLAEWVRRRA
ncbi:MAG: olefin beta-lactone synthetase OleC [Acidobacteriota bacterium]